MRLFKIFMGKKCFISLILLFLFVVSISSNIAGAGAGSNSISSMDVDLHVKSDGTLHVKKILHYSISGGNDIYRDYDIEREQNPENLKVSIQGAYTDLFIHDLSPGKDIEMLFFSDPEKTIRASNRNVNVIIEYDLKQAITFYNDTAFLQYKLVDDRGYQYVGKVNANIHLKSSNGVQYWLNTSTSVKNSSWNGNNLQINARYILEDTPLEVNMIIPKAQFDKDPKNGVTVNESFLNEIKMNQTMQQAHQEFQDINNNISPFIAFLLLLVSFTPLFIYLIYGREPKINYHTKYETDLPTDDPPAIINAICAGDPKKIGVPNLDGFRATILDLIDRNYLILDDAPYGEDYDTSGLFLQINPDYDPSTLWNFELQVIGFLKEYEQDGIISMDLITESLGYYNSSRFFKYTYKSWQKEVKKTITDGNFKEAFYSKGDKYLKIFGFVGVVTVFAFLRVVPKSFPSILFLCMLILGAASVISLVLPQGIAGQWTNYGREYYEKWHSFKRYIQDYSLIKEYPPESVHVWNKYLVYATALGVAEGVRQSMGLHFPKDQNDDQLLSLLDNTLSSIFDSDRSYHK